jgi:hypothetical protein
VSEPYLCPWCSNDPLPDRVPSEPICPFCKDHTAGTCPGCQCGDCLQAEIVPAEQEGPATGLSFWRPPEND